MLFEDRPGYCQLRPLSFQQADEMVGIGKPLDLPPCEDDDLATLRQGSGENAVRRCEFGRIAGDADSGNEDAYRAAAARQLDSVGNLGRGGLADGSP